MLQTLLNVFRIKELRDKILFTFGMLIVFRIGHWIPLPGINQQELKRQFEAIADDSIFGRVATVVATFSGGALSHSTIFGLGIMPYITAGIIIQLVGSASPTIKKLQEEGPTGRQKILEWTRYLTLVLCVVQGVTWLVSLRQMGLIYPAAATSPLWWVVAITALTAGCIFLMWLGEQIDRFGIGNGVSMIIMAGILATMPTAIFDIYNGFDPSDADKMGYPGLLGIAAGFTLVVAGSVLMTIAQRRIPIQQAKHTRGKRVFGGQRSFLPLRVNHGGVMPVVFASSLMVIPGVMFAGMAQASGAAANPGWFHSFAQWLNINFADGAYLYVLLYIAMVYFFSYFWITVQFNPEEMSKQLKEHGSFIPGLRPGPRTAEYLESVMTRITYVGAGFLALIAILPMIVNSALGVAPSITHFLGGTGLLIVVSVTLDFLQRVEAALLMRNYSGFLAGSGGEPGPRLRGPRG